jgi:glutamate racemase
MTKIAVFDSGLGSLSIITPLQRKIGAEIIYFADKKNFPYGNKSIHELRKIIESTIIKLEETFSPDLIIMASNTPSLLLKNITKRKKIIGVFPPLKLAAEITKTNSIAILVTKSVAKSNALKNYIRNNLSKKIEVMSIDSSSLVNLIESGKFISNKKLCKRKIKLVLASLPANNVDVAVLSSTHLPFLLPLLNDVFPNIKFIDPTNDVSNRIKKVLSKKKNRTKSLKIFTSGNVRIFENQLRKMGITKKVSLL